MTDVLRPIRSGYLRSPHDPRDYPWPATVTRTVREAEPPARYRSDARNPLPVLDQGYLPKCATAAAATIKTAQERRDARRTIVFDDDDLYARVGEPCEHGNRPFTPCAGCGTLSVGGGTYLRRALDELRGVGMLAKASRRSYQISGYAAVPYDKPDAVRRALVHHRVLLGGFAVPRSFLDGGGREFRDDGSGEIVGAHAIAVTGYDPDGVLTQNTWGCYDDQTEILTAEGWRRFDALDAGTLVATLNPDTEEIEYQEITARQRYHYNGDLWHYRWQGVDLLVTPNHSLYVGSLRKGAWWKLIPAEEITQRHWRMRKDGRWLGFEASTHVVGDTTVAMDDWLRFLGYFVSEGHATERRFWRAPRREWQTNYRIDISQTKPANLPIMQAVLDRLPFTFYRARHSWITTRRALYEELVPLGKSPERRLPPYVMSLSARQARILLDALMLGDGARRASQEGTYYTSSRTLADQVQQLALHAGIAADVSSIDRRGRVNAAGTTRHVEYQVYLRGTRTQPRCSTGAVAERVPYSGEVFCVTVPNHIVYVRRNGRAVWSGNSSWGDNGRRLVTWAFVARNFFELYALFDENDPPRRPKRNGAGRSR